MSRGHALGLLFHLRSCAHALRMQPEKPKFSLRLIRKNHETDTADDLDASKLSELGTRLLDLRDGDHSEPTSGRPEWSLRQQLLCDVRGHRRYISGHGFPCRRLFRPAWPRYVFAQLTRLANVVCLPLGKSCWRSSSVNLKSRANRPTTSLTRCSCPSPATFKSGSISVS